MSEWIFFGCGLLAGVIVGIIIMFLILINGYAGYFSVRKEKDDK